MTTTLREVVFAVRHGQAALVAELAGYLVLLAADAAAVRPILVSADALGLDADGEVTLHGAPASEGDAERALRGVLAGLLGLLRSPAPNLQRVAERPELRGLATLVLELEAALVPVNRKAARRSLSRLYRETARARAMVPDGARGMEIPVTVAPMAAAPMAAAPVFAAPVVAVAVAPLAAAPVVAAPVVVAPAVAEPVVTVVVEPPAVVVAAANTAEPNTAAENSAEPSAAEVSPRRATPPPLPSKRPLQLALTLTPPPAPSLAQAPSAQAPSAPSPAHAVVLDAMLSALGGVSSPRPGAVDTATPNSAVWVEEEDVLTEMWGGARVVEERTVIDAPVAARLNSPAPPESALDLPESSPAPSEVRTPFRVSTFPLTPQPEPEALAADVPLFDSPAEPEHRPSDVSELLSRMRRPVSVEGEVRRGLLGLSRLEELAEAART